MRYLDVDELAALLGESAGSIKRKIRTNSSEVPPRVHLHGTRMLRWRLPEVENWMWETGWARSKRS
jgi:predicted DNA-binding transcriptional regulator AlpA